MFPRTNTNYSSPLSTPELERAQNELDTLIRYLSKNDQIRILDILEYKKNQSLGLLGDKKTEVLSNGENSLVRDLNMYKNGQGDDIKKHLETISERPRVMEYLLNHNLARVPNTTPNNNESNIESIFLPILALNCEFPVLRLVSFLYTYYKINPIFKYEVDYYFFKFKVLITKKFKVISMCFVIILFSVLLSYYVGNPVNCDAPRA